ncbi:hypothetical protein GQ55_5G322600 [Panicum hallii var. hallii]|uniref:Uncharacterized protein n=2 Tax=Panicum hallii TaxID=206008 RepID=A0A2T7DLR6_9POAL|nr:hypothetical protein PAHAL_5G322200 [Panicum hallii]PUZ56524.1 hypothetical protein GQ55_5G322600 [Panicum hallii var. hallii]
MTALCRYLRDYAREKIDRAAAFSRSVSGSLHSHSRESGKRRRAAACSPSGLVRLDPQGVEAPRMDQRSCDGVRTLEMRPHITSIQSQAQSKTIVHLACVVSCSHATIRGDML